MDNPTIPQKRLKRARQSLAILEEQAAGYTVLTIPAHLKIELDEKRQEVADLEAGLSAPGAGEFKPGNTAPTERATLRRNLVASFSAEELRDLCFDLGIEHENLPQTKAGMARGVVEHCERRGLTGELVALCRRLRPQVTW